MVDGKGSCNETWSHHTCKSDNPGLRQAELQNYSKHELPHAAAAGFSFFPFEGSCFWCPGHLCVVPCMVGTTPECCHSPITPIGYSEVCRTAQFHTRCFICSSARIGAALAKATLTHLSGTLCLPAPIPVPSAHLARNGPGVAEFHPPVVP
jgi:hypothetical protein